MFLPILDTADNLSCNVIILKPKYWFIQQVIRNYQKQVDEIMSKYWEKMPIHPTSQVHLWIADLKVYWRWCSCWNKLDNAIMKYHPIRNFTKGFSMWLWSVHIILYRILKGSSDSAMLSWQPQNQEPEIRFSFIFKERLLITPLIFWCFLFQPITCLTEIVGPIGHRSWIMKKIR